MTTAASIPSPLLSSPPGSLGLWHITGHAHWGELRVGPTPRGRKKVRKWAGRRERMHF